MKVARFDKMDRLIRFYATRLQLSRFYNSLPTADRAGTVLKAGEARATEISSSKMIMPEGDCVL
jgi:hypothetical protein